MHTPLSQEEKSVLVSQHKQERDKRICDRIKAVLLFDQGWTTQQISHALLLSDESVRQHVQEYHASRKLAPNHKGSCSKLSPLQTHELIAHLENTTYLFVKDIVAYVHATFGLAYTVAGMTCWLKQHNFSYKKPAVTPGKANRALQEQWIREYEELKNRLSPTETICFIDGVHPTHNSKPAYGWIRKGIRKELLTNTGRQRINLSGAIDILSKNVLVREDETLNATSTISFLSALENNYPLATRVHVFCDNARYYRNQEVTCYLATSKLEMHFLPPYSPNLNPIERLWKLMNESVLYNKYYEKWKDFRNAVLGFLESVNETMQETLERRITDRFCVIGK